MDLAIVDLVLRGVVALCFAYVAVAGAAGAVKLALMDQEIRLLAKQQSEIIAGLREALEKKYEEAQSRKQKSLAKLS